MKYLVDIGIFRPVWVEVECNSIDQAIDLTLYKYFNHPEHTLDKNKIRVKVLSN